MQQFGGAMNMTENSEIPNPAPLPENSPAAAPAYEQAREEISSQNSFGEKLRAATSATLEKFHIVRRGRGRPKNDGSPKKSDTVETVGGGAPTPVAVAAVESGDSVAAAFGSPAHVLFRRVVAKAVKSAVSFGKGLIRIKGEAAGLSEEFLEKSLAACTPEEKQFQDVAESADYVAIKYGWKIDKMPEISLAVDVIGIASPFASLFFLLNSEIKRKRKMEGPAPAPTVEIAPEK